MPKRKEWTAKDLGLVDGTKLSPTYAHSKNDYKVIDDYVLGYYIVGGTHQPFRIAPLYRATIYRKEGKHIHVLTTHEVGPYFNNHHRPDELPDHDGDALAHLAATALLHLEQHAGRRERARKWKKQRSKIFNKRSKKRSKATT